MQATVCISQVHWPCCPQSQCLCSGRVAESRHREQQPGAVDHGMCGFCICVSEQSRKGIFPWGLLKKGKISTHSEFSLLLTALVWGWI